MSEGRHILDLGQNHNHNVTTYLVNCLKHQRSSLNVPITNRHGFEQRNGHHVTGYHMKTEAS